MQKKRGGNNGNTNVYAVLNNHGIENSIAVDTTL